MTDWQHGFYKLSLAKRQQIVAHQFELTGNQQELLQRQVDGVNEQMVENYLTSFHLPEGIAVNLLVNQQKYVVPMVVEEPSVVAAASNGAKLVAKNGGFKVTSNKSMMIGQVVITDLKDVDETVHWLQQETIKILQVANQAKPSMQQRGGGATKLKIRTLKKDWLAIEISVDTGEAMGANGVNTMCEAVGHWLTDHGFNVLTAILSNFATQSLQTVTCAIKVIDLATDMMTGEQVAKKITQLSELAQVDPYRATTHNKGIMNGIDAAVIASGNDWRAIESGAHAYAAIDGAYKGLSTWQVENGYLNGTMTLPLSLGIVGGSIDIVPLVEVNQRMMAIESAVQLAQVIISVGLAQNLAALKALATNGIQAGHMELQYRSLAVAIGASESEVEQVVKQLKGIKHVDRNTATAVLNQLRKDKNNGRN
ncbi:hydroxymethylglutaryl-CoA reductase, degradative [Paucilactobacillus kaifaensis]|uniref:hydroxymethylglutaryl-CoA reductase, degradative n=1 Tax=Paucilactobacillus kaifaensis TaxID=2559921 RepID=UPI0010F4C197|nr:hydroxymethylglutaryl-CoA reductase, degradative [Paucilactobacillus kaifaensis]